VGVVTSAPVAHGRREEKGVITTLTPAEPDELTRLRGENKQPCLERDILSRAAAWFARETGAVQRPGKPVYLAGVRRALPERRKTTGSAASGLSFRKRFLALEASRLMR
jgi:hypothetical protein